MSSHLEVLRYMAEEMRAHAMLEHADITEANKLRRLVYQWAHGLETIAKSAAPSPQQPAAECTCPHGSAVRFKLVDKACPQHAAAKPAEPQPATINLNEIDSKLMDAEPQQDGVAVAWRYRYSDSADWLYKSTRPSNPPPGNPDGKVIEPLYTAPQPAARRVTEGAVLGHLPAPIRNPEAWPPNYADGWNDCARTAADGVCESFANGGDS